MILYYLDASAWVKRYYQELGTPWVESLFTRNQFLGSAALGFVEVTATLARKQLAERMDDATLAGFFERLEKDWDDFYQVHLDQAMLEAARSLLPGPCACEERMPFTWRLPPA